MESNSPRFSILVPAFKGMPFLQYTIHSVLVASSQDFELVVSDDRSDDGTLEFLSGIVDPRLRVLQTPAGSSFSMVEHWEWLLSQACGDWVMFLGQDDGLQSHFFELATHLANRAEKLGLRTIAAQRAEFVWPGDGDGDGEAGAEAHVELRDPSRPLITRRSLERGALVALLSLRSYHFLPQMYTNSLWRMSLIREVRQLQDGVFFTCHPQDANIAALGVRLEKEYLYSGISLGWVGTSKKSAGLAIAQSLNPISSEAANLAREYAQSVKTSAITYPSWAGDFEMGENAIYFWQALRNTHSVGSTPLDRLIVSVPFVTLMLSFALARHRVGTWTQEKLIQYRSIARQNRVPYGILVFLARLIRGGFVSFLTLRSALRRARGFFRGDGKSRHWTREGASDLPEVLPLVQAVGARAYNKINLLFLEKE